MREEEFKRLAKAILQHVTFHEMVSTGGAPYIEVSIQVDHHTQISRVYPDKPRKSLATDLVALNEYIKRDTVSKSEGVVKHRHGLGE